MNKAGISGTARHGQECWLLGLMLLPLWIGCQEKVPQGSLILTQTPLVTAAPDAAPATILDERYPAGSRVVLATRPFRPAQVRVLSGGLWAAGDPVVSPDSETIWFAGKAASGSSWQIYQVAVSGGRPKQITSASGGAMSPAISGNGDLIFSSPVPKPGASWDGDDKPALYAQSPQGMTRKLTFSTTAAVEPTVLADGRILFISARPTAAQCDKGPELSLFTINNDGTELTTFALDHDGPPLVHRPRELPNGLILFLSAEPDHALRPESVRKARPFASRRSLWPFSGFAWSAVEPAGDLSLLACLKPTIGSAAVYKLTLDAQEPGQALFADPAWNQIEAMRLARQPRPMGHVSAIVPGKQTGTILCLDANFTRAPAANSVQTKRAERVRVLVAAAKGESRIIGEVQVQPDGSFLAEVPADTPLGFETVDGLGVVLQRLSPALWVRPGENRSCIGCHEPSNRSPRNVRPLAVTLPPVVLTQAGPARSKPNP